ncbi:MAG TPA: lysophospholipid acyltransferase family protein [Chitinophagaceae bacterium]|nr:1-acyl-sn-glycerol-3-phosphate acyltransferase [Chitinophagaceae bacterium]MBP6477665.1 1-acyl-sn-glycerol-3-phosphate acyltransferase [Chitinophagaceae bacterium]MBP7109792.1 1-acyl-sn-glycerol-3-phosphate acyltransferase [Chitinophagaceae bacterium]HQV56017.1 lysophospholipid acyltransferase family protein [Chitinophagaceae bacterium]HQZ51192.1 lysophospholipid acyltransferase family protein [Chitinophagaceae bacterium]
MKVLLTPLKFIYSVYALITFVAIMLLIFPFVIISSFFGPIKGGNMVMRCCRVWADIWFLVIFIWHKKIVEVGHNKKRPYIFVTNHISYLDSAMIPKAYRQPIRPLGKIEMSKVPVFGFIYRNAIVTVDRSSAANRAKSVLLLKSVINKGISVLVFPEGTFNMGTTPLKEFYDGAFRLAIETQTPIKPVLYLDAYRRMPYESLFKMTPGRSRILYLEEISVVGYSIDDLDKLKEEVYAIMEKKLIEYNGAWRKLPERK